MPSQNLLRYVELAPEGESLGTVIFLHGWPDSLETWNDNAEVVRKHGYTCVLIDLPNYSGACDIAWGEDFPAVTKRIVATIRHAIADHKNTDGGVVVVGHDWGAIFAYMVEKSAPEGLIKKLVTVDVGGRVAVKSLVAGLTIAAYQLWLVWALILRNVLPVVGKPVGDWMTWACARLWAKAPFYRDGHGAHINYPYLHSWKWRLFGGDGGLAALHKYSPRIPTMYLYGAKKPFQFHSDGWIRELNDRADCKVIAVECGHWVEVDKPVVMEQELLGFIAE